MKLRVSAPVEVVSTIDGMYSPGGYVNAEVAKHLGRDPDVGWSMTGIHTDISATGSSRSRVILVREIAKGK